MPSRTLLALPLLALIGATLASTSLAARRAAERIETHDNDRPAGSLRNGVLTLSLEARVGTWHPHGPKIVGADVPAIGEVGKRLQIPSPLIRVPAGTDVVLTVKNTLFARLTLHGLVSRPVPQGAPTSIELRPGETREIRFRLDAPGTYLYWGTTMGRPLALRTREDAQLSGAIVVDEPGKPRPTDRIFVVGQWSDTTTSEDLAETQLRRFLLVVNGRSWPYTERLSYTAGDTVRWRLVNASANVHPMHLHGFHFSVDSRGDGLGDTVYSADRRALAVTERMRIGSTFTMTWVPVREGNWLFHCHTTPHFAPRGVLGDRLEESIRPLPRGHPMSHAEEAMSGLVIGVSVAAKRQGTRTLVDRLPRRRLTMLVRERENGTTRAPIYGVSLFEGGYAPPMDDEPRSGPPLVLERDVPAEITVVNRTSSPTSIHWHGMELESYFDGVAGFSGRPGRLSPLVGPGDSFRVRMQPPRSGTFIYHTHADELTQQPAGLSGPLIVLEPGQRWDPATDIPVLIASPPDSAAERRAVYVNGSTTPAPVSMRVGVPHRLRIINITIARPSISVSLRRSNDTVMWRPLAKDGADLPGERRSEVTARQLVSIGETYDYEFSPAEAGEYGLEVRTGLGRLLATLPLIAVAPDNTRR